jgi:hypothetical protein
MRAFDLLSAKKMQAFDLLLNKIMQAGGAA